MANGKKPSTVAWLFSKTRYSIVGVLLLSVVNVVLALSFIWLALLSETLIDTAAQLMNQSYDNVWECIKLPQIYIPAIQVLCTIVLQIVLNITAASLRVRTAGKVEMQLRASLFSGLLRKDYTSFHRYHSGEVLNRLTADVNHVVNGVTGLLPAATSMFTKLVGGLIVLCRISPWFTVVMIGFGILILLCSRFYGKPMKKLHKECQSTDGKTRSFVQESLGNMLPIKAFSNESVMERQLDQLQQDNFLVRIKRMRLSNLGNTGLFLVLIGAYYMALIWGVVCLIAGTLTFGMLTALLQIFEQLKAPLRNASSLLPQYYAMMASAERLEELERLPTEESSLSQERMNELSSKFSALVFKHVFFDYDADTPVLEDVSFALNRGEIVSLVGESGIGKSTLMKLVLSILRPQNGEIYLDCGTDKQPLTAATRSLFSYVPQGNTIFAGTLRENVAFFRNNISDDAINKALSLSCLESFVNTLPDGLDTMLGEHGFDISEGQAQRISIARALVGTAPILLLDECTSALDNVTETKLLQNIKQMTDKTVLMISHRNTTVAGGDRVLRIADRHVTE